MKGFYDSTESAFYSIRCHVSRTYPHLVYVDKNTLMPFYPLSSLNVLSHKIELIGSV